MGAFQKVGNVCNPQRAPPSSTAGSIAQGEAQAAPARVRAVGWKAPGRRPQTPLAPAVRRAPVATAALRAESGSRDAEDEAGAAQHAHVTIAPSCLAGACRREQSGVSRRPLCGDVEPSPPGLRSRERTRSALGSERSHGSTRTRLEPRVETARQGVRGSLPQPRLVESPAGAQCVGLRAAERRASRHSSSWRDRSFFLGPVVRRLDDFHWRCRGGHRGITLAARPDMAARGGMEAWRPARSRCGPCALRRRSHDKSRSRTHPLRVTSACQPREGNAAGTEACYPFFPRNRLVTRGRTNYRNLCHLPQVFR